MALHGADELALAWQIVWKIVGLQDIDGRLQYDKECTVAPESHTS